MGAKCPVGRDMRKKRILVIALEFVLVVAVVAGMMFYVGQMTQPTPVYIFNKPMVTADVVTERDLSVVEIPKNGISTDFILERDQIVGKVLTTEVRAGQYVLGDFLSDEEKLDPFKVLDLSKMRMISFSIEMEEALAGNINRGDQVDLIFIGKSSDVATNREFTYSKIFMQGVYVYSVSTDDGYPYEKKVEYGDSSIAGTQEFTMDGTASDGNLSIITLAVTAPQAEEIAARMETGKIQVLGRFSNGVDVPSLGYSINGSSRVFAGPGNVESDAR